MSYEKKTDLIKNINLGIQKSTGQRNNHHSNSGQQLNDTLKNNLILNDE